MICPGDILWHRGGDGEVNDAPNLVLHVHDVGIADATAAGTIDFLCLETAERFTLSQRIIAVLIRDRLAYFTGNVRGSTESRRHGPMGEDGW